MVFILKLLVNQHKNAVRYAGPTKDAIKINPNGIPDVQTSQTFGLCALADLV
jgi:hypothetical protein